MLVDRARYEKNDLIKAVVEYKAKHGRLPEKKDWEGGDIAPSMRTFQRRFKSIEDVFNEAEQYDSVSDFENKLDELEKEKELAEYKRKYRRNSQTKNKEEDPKPKAKRIKSTAKQHSGFQCSFCGGWTTGVNDYYSSLKKILLMRFKERLEHTPPEHHWIVWNCIEDVFGKNNIAVQEQIGVKGNAIPMARSTSEVKTIKGHIEGVPVNVITEKQKKELPWSWKDTLEEEQNSLYKLRCHKCSKLKDEWEVTSDTNSRPFAEYICEDCLSKINNKKDTKDIKGKSVPHNKFKRRLINVKEQKD